MANKKLGHGRGFRRVDEFKDQGLMMRVLLAPMWLYREVVYRGRPDVLTAETKAPQWSLIQSEWRYFHSMLAYVGPPSHILWHIKWPMAFNTLLALLVTIDAYDSHHGFLPNFDEAVVMAWRMISFVMALLLAFRVNRTYDRWWNARQVYGAAGNHMYTLAQQAVVWVQDQAIKSDILRWAGVYHFTVLQMATNANELDPQAAALLSPVELQLVQQGGNCRLLVLLRLRQLVAQAQLPIPQFEQMETSITRSYDTANVVARIRNLCMPYSLTLLCTGFVELFLIFQPFGLIQKLDPSSQHVLNRGMQPVLGMLLYVFCSILLLGLDEVTNQMEDPYPFLPVQALAERTLNDISKLEKQAADLVEVDNLTAVAGPGAWTAPGPDDAAHTLQTGKVDNQNGGATMPATRWPSDPVAVISHTS